MNKLLGVILTLFACMFLFALFNNPYLFESEAEEKARIQKEEEECFNKFIPFRVNYIKETLVPIARTAIESQKFRLEQASKNKEPYPETCSSAISSSVTALGFGVVSGINFQDVSVYCEIMIAHRTPLDLAVELADTQMKFLIVSAFWDTPEGKCNLPVKVGHIKE
jgi:hypothetical protein